MSGQKGKGKATEEDRPGRSNRGVDYYEDESLGREGAYSPQRPCARISRGGEQTARHAPPQAAGSNPRGRGSGAQQGRASPSQRYDKPPNEVYAPQRHNPQAPWDPEIRYGHNGPNSGLANSRKGSLQTMGKLHDAHPSAKNVVSLPGK
jgi:hypothetical protein